MTACSLCNQYVCLLCLLHSCPHHSRCSLLPAVRPYTHTSFTHAHSSSSPLGSTVLPSAAAYSVTLLNTRSHQPAYLCSLLWLSTCRCLPSLCLGNRLAGCITDELGCAQGGHCTHAPQHQLLQVWPGSCAAGGVNGSTACPPQVHVREGARQHASPGSQRVLSQPDLTQAQRVVQQGEGHQGRQAQQQHQPAALLRDAGYHCARLGETSQLALHPGPCAVARDTERGHRAQR
mmetsp:Transcript_17194/g.43126  ORF Transcript_17194/g.43126 Transcript_17194/m.43126 type:complete len:233 (-) Transcript_17194:643-1341(-)